MMVSITLDSGELRLVPYKHPENLEWLKNNSPNPFVQSFCERMLNIQYEIFSSNVFSEPSLELQKLVHLSNSTTNFSVHLADLHKMGCISPTVFTLCLAEAQRIAMLAKERMPHKLLRGYKDVETESSDDPINWEGSFKMTADKDIVIPDQSDPKEWVTHLHTTLSPQHLPPGPDERNRELNAFEQSSRVFSEGAIHELAEEYTNLKTLLYELRVHWLPLSLIKGRVDSDQSACMQTIVEYLRRHHMDLPNEIQAIDLMRAITPILNERIFQLEAKRKGVEKTYNAVFAFHKNFGQTPIPFDQEMTLLLEDYGFVSSNSLRRVLENYGEVALKIGSRGLATEQRWHDLLASVYDTELAFNRLHYLSNNGYKEPLALEFKVWHDLWGGDYLPYKTETPSLTRYLPNISYKSPLDWWYKKK